ncbi:hypothetical protein [Brevibacillus borstelensis]|uniref:hypothetical protein n=1 Tax=Brevibacillus borstelensis TaxID=45462 RepID=UPI002E1DAC31|nr:hypothetical protein [Brevibacillus borstelensis]
MSIKRKLSAFAVLSTVALNAFVGQAFAAVTVSNSNVANVTVNVASSLNFNGTTVSGNVNLNADTTIVVGAGTDFSAANVTLAPTAPATINLGGVQTKQIVIATDNVKSVAGFVAPTEGVKAAPGVTTDGVTFTTPDDQVVTPEITPQPADPVDTKAIDDAIAAATAAKQGVVISADGADVEPTSQWVTQEANDALDASIAKATAAKDTVKTAEEVAAAADELDQAVQTYNAAKKAGTKA